MRPAAVVERGTRLTGYTTGIGFFGHAVGETAADLQALIGAAPAFDGPGFLIPLRDADLTRWCLESGLRIVQPMTLMTMGPYDEPAGHSCRRSFTDRISVFLSQISMEESWLHTFLPTF